MFYSSYGSIFHFKSTRRRLRGLVRHNSIGDKYGQRYDERKDDTPSQVLRLLSLSLSEAQSLVLTNCHEASNNHAHKIHLKLGSDSYLLSALLII